jgi:myo-inositol-1(or 4)-monophosphatase
MTKAHSQGPHVDLTMVTEWVREAGKIALGHFNRVEGTLKQDRSLVSAADLEIEDLLTAHIRAAYPDHGLIGEEGTKDIRGEYVWAIDPLDGTRAFLSGLPVWGISVGLLWRGQPWLGVFHLPLLDEWYHTASPSTGAFWNEQSISCPQIDGWDENSLLCIPGDVHLRYTIDFPGTVRAMGSAAAHLCYVARGNAAAVFLDRPALWDVAAGAAILSAAGGVLRHLEGEELPLEHLLDGDPWLPPLLGAHPAVIDQLRSYIHPIDAS